MSGQALRSQFVVPPTCRLYDGPGDVRANAEAPSSETVPRAGLARLAQHSVEHAEGRQLIRLQARLLHTLAVKL